MICQGPCPSCPLVSKKKKLLPRLQNLPCPRQPESPFVEPHKENERQPVRSLTYQVKVHYPHDPDDKRKIDNGDDHNQKNKEVDAALSPSIDTNLVNNSRRILVIPVYLICGLCRHLGCLSPS